MIKKGIHILFAIYMIMMIAGISIYKHYCTGELISTSLLLIPHDCCEGSCPFCSNEVDTFETSKDILTRSINFMESIKSISLFDVFICIKLNPTTIDFSLKPKYRFPNVMSWDLIRELAKIQVFLN